MKIISRVEELIMLSIWRLGEEAYTVPIMEEANRHTGSKWILSGIFIPLNRLEKKGLIASELGDPTPERGGKRKRFYKITDEGFAALKEVRDVEKSMWDGLSDIPA